MKAYIKPLITAALVLAAVFFFVWNSAVRDSLSPEVPSVAVPEVKVDTSIRESAPITTVVTEGAVASAAPVQGSVRLLVYNSDGAPAPGVSVEGFRAPKTIGVSESVPMFAGMTGNDGSYVATGLSLGTILVRAMAETMAAHGRCNVTWDAPDAELMLVLEPAGTIAGVVLDANGLPVPDARLSPALLDGKQVSRRAWSGGEVYTGLSGEFALAGLPPGAWSLHVASADFGSVLSRPIPTGTLDAQIVLGAGVAISGRVVFAESGSAAPGSKVTLSHAEEPAFPVSILAGNDGEFTVAAVAPGNYVMSVSGETGFAAEAAFYPLEVGTQAIDDVVLRLAREGILRGRVYAKNSGEGIEGAVVEARASGGTKYVFASPPSDAAGRYEIRGVPGGLYDVVGPGPSGFLQGFPADGNRHSVQLKPGETKDNLDFAVERGCTVSGRVLDAAGAPASGVEVRARQGGVDCFTTSGRDGRYAVTNIISGEPILLAASSARAASLDRGPLDVPEADLEGVDLVLSELRDGLIEGTVTDNRNRPLRARVIALADTETRVSLPPMDTTDAEGRFLMPGVAPGNYSLLVQPGASESRPLLQVVVRPSRALRGLRLVYEMAESLTISGRVESESGTPLVATLQLFYQDGIALTPMADTACDMEGMFLFENAAPGTYMIEAFKEGYERIQTPGVSAGADDVVIQMVQAAHTTVQVVSEAGEPVPTFEIALVRPGGEPGPELGPPFEAQSYFMAVSDPDGMYTITAPNAVQVLVRAAGYARVRQNIESGPDAVNVIVMSRAEAIHGRVTTQDGSPVPGASVAYGPLPFPVRHLSGKAVVITDESGTFSVVPNEPGQPIYLSAFHERYGFGEIAGEGTEPIEIVLTPGGSVTGRIIQGGASVQRTEVRLQGLAGMDGAGIDASGFFAVNHVPPGDYTIFLRDPESGERLGEQPLVVAPGVETEVTLSID